jgi:hypothetical protein
VCAGQMLQAGATIEKWLDHFRQQKKAQRAG